MSIWDVINARLDAAAEREEREATKLRQKAASLRYNRWEKCKCPTCGHVYHKDRGSGTSVRARRKWYTTFINAATGERVSLKKYVLTNDREALTLDLILFANAEPGSVRHHYTGRLLPRPKS